MVRFSILLALAVPALSLPTPRPLPLRDNAPERLSALQTNLQAAGSQVLQDLSDGNRRGVPRISGPLDHDQAATLKAGLQETRGSGSLNDPDILELATVQELAEMNPKLSTLDKLMRDLGATFYLEQSRDLTMFMPTDEAFKKSEINILELPWGTKWRLFQYLIVPNQVIKLEDLNKGDHEFISWEGSPVKITVPARSSNIIRKYKVNDDFSVVGTPPGIETFNGIAYIIDGFIVPANVSEILASEIHIEDLVDNRQTSTTIYAIGNHDKGERAEDHQATVVKGGDSAEEAGLGGGNVQPVAAISTDAGVAPAFVQNINIAHDQYNLSVAERKKIREDVNAKKGESDSSAVSNSASNTTPSIGTLGIVDPTVPVSTPTVAEDPIGLISPSRIDGPPAESPSSAIQALGIGDSIPIFSPTHETRHFNSGAPHRPHGPPSYPLSSFPPQPASPQTTDDSAVFPKHFGWAGTAPGWDQHEPGKVLPASNGPQRKPKSSSGITAYNKKNSPSTEEISERRDRNRHWRRRSRLNFFGIDNPEDEGQHGPYSSGTYDSGNDGTYSDFAAEPEEPPPLWLPATPVANTAEAQEPSIIESPSSSSPTAKDLFQMPFDDSMGPGGMIPDGGHEIYEGRYLLSRLAASAAASSRVAE